MQKSDKPVQFDASNASAPRARGRPRAFDREAALAQATRLFWTKGYEATSIADLTDAMGIGSPSLYAAFGSKDALYAEAVQHYEQTYRGLVWAGFDAARTAREAVWALLRDSAAGLTGTVQDVPQGCMVALSTVDGEAHGELCALLRAARSGTLVRVTARLKQAIQEGELPPETDVHALARFVQTVQGGMSILARDGVSGDELYAVAEVAMLGFDARTGGKARKSRK